MGANAELPTDTAMETPESVLRPSRRGHQATEQTVLYREHRQGPNPQKPVTAPRMARARGSSTE